MRYLLNAEYAIRSFIGIPHCVYKKGADRADRLTPEEFAVLLQCDGTHELNEDAFVTKRLRAMVHPAENGEELSSWQRYRHCDNRYFPAVNWMITGKCNYNCLHCFNAADNNPLAAEWSMQDAEILMDEAEQCGVNAFTLTGGEPMLHPHFMDIVRGIHQRGMSVTEINTNGAFLTRDILWEMKMIGARPLMKISFDGLGWHDWMRNRTGAEETALAAIRLCVEEGFPVKVQFNVHRRNVDTVTKTAQLLESMGVQETRIIRTSESPRWAELGKENTLTFPEYYEHLLSFSEEWLKTPHTMKITLWHMAALPLIMGATERASLPQESSEWDRLKRFRLRQYACPDCRFLAAVTAAGDLVPCMQMSGRFSQDGTRLGNIKGGGLPEMLKEGAYLDQVCLTKEDILNASPSCQKCSHFIDCQGGCRAIAIITTNEYLREDLARCIYYKEGYAKRMDKLILDAIAF